MLARLVDKNRLGATLFVAAGMLVPLGILFSAGVTALVTLRRSWGDGLLVGVLGFGLIAGLLALLVGPVSDWGLIVQGLLLIVTVAVAQVLRSVNSLAAALWLALAVCMAGLLAYWLLSADPVGFWREAFSRLLTQFAQGGGNLTTSEMDRLNSLQWRGVTGHVFGCCFLLLSGGLFLGRSWQAQLVNPGGFRGEFHRLRLGRGLALGSAIVFMSSGLAPYDLLLNMAAILIYVWMVAGFSVVHGVAGILQSGSGWLWLVYILAALTWAGASPLFLVIPLTGLINEFVDLREIVSRRKNAG